MSEWSEVAQLLVIPLPLLAALAAVVILIKLVRIPFTRRLLPEDPIDAWAQVLGLAACGAVIPYGVSAFYLSPFQIDPGDACGGVESAHYIVRYFPPSARCVFQDASGYDRVSGWVDPVLFVSLGVAAVAAAVLLGYAVRAVAAGGHDGERTGRGDA